MAAAERISISLSPEDRELITEAAQKAGQSVSAWMVHAAREEARWQKTREIAHELAEEAGVTEEHRAWARKVLGIDSD